MKLNVIKPITTHEGGNAIRLLSAEAQLRRCVMSCMLWEKEFYEDGKSIADRISEACARLSSEDVARIAVEARTKHNLRHVPLLLLAEKPNAQSIYETINRADEMAELLAIYWRNGRKPLPAQLKKGLSKAFTKFDEYELAKYNRDGAVKLRDVLFLTHAKPKDAAQADVWKRLVEGKLATPDTWEVALSNGEDKKATFERLLRENKLGYLALMRNLRNMERAGVNLDMVKDKLLNHDGIKYVLPFRFVAAARACPSLERTLDEAMMKSIDALPSLRGRTVVLVDVSGSMDEFLSAKSDLKRIDAAAALAGIVKSDDLRVFTFSNDIVEVPSRRGMAGVDAVINSQQHGCTYLGRALDKINALVNYDRIIVITDEQSADNVTDPVGKGYMINVASAKNGVGYGPWTHIDGFSENVLKFIYETEEAE